MFSCCACTRPSKLDTEEVRSDETSDSDDDDDSLEEDEKSDNDDQSSDDDTSNEEDEKAKSTPKSCVVENGTQSPTKGSVSSPQKSSTSTVVLSQKNLSENEIPSPTKIEAEVLRKSSFEEKAPSPTESQTEVESSLQKSPTFEKDDSIKMKHESPEKGDSFEDKSPERNYEEMYPIAEENIEKENAVLEKNSQEKYSESEKNSEEQVSDNLEDKVSNSQKVSNTESAVDLPEPINQFSVSKEFRKQTFYREMSQSFDDEDPSPENSSNTGSVVHIPSSIPDNKITSPTKISTPKNELSSPEKDVPNLEKRESVEENISSPESKSITQISSTITDNELQKDFSPPKSPPGNEILIPPPENESFGLPPDDFVTLAESTEIIQPPDSGDYFLPHESTNYIPLPKTDDVLINSGYFIPPLENDSFNLESVRRSFLLPENTQDLIPPQEYEDFIPPPENEGFLPILENEEILPPPENERFLPPSENEKFLASLENDRFLSSSENERLTLENQALPPPENEFTTPSPENIVSSPQKSSSIDSDVPSPQNTWTSSSTDDEKRAIEITEFIGIIGSMKREKSPLHHAPAYIERTIDDGQEEGDDSVFESYPTPPPPPEIDFVATSRKPTVPPPIPQWLSQEDDDENISEGYGGMQEPPATPVARDELALRRHRFFSDLLQATRNSAEHRVSFDPLGPTVHPGCESDDRDEHLEELVTRLENVTRRLERVPQGAPETQEIAVQTKTPSPEKSPSPQKSSKDSISSEDQCSQGSSSSVSSAASSIVEINNMSAAGYEDLVSGPVREYLNLSRKIGGDVTAHSQLVEQAFQIQLAFIRTASTRPAPSNQTEQVSLLGPTSTQIQQIQEFRDKHRASPFFNHLSAISESIPALGWVAVSPTPAPYVKEMNDAGQFYTNRVLKDWKEKDKTHVEWCKAWVQTLSELQQYVRKFHTTGLVWAKGGAIPPPPMGGVPPPPPPSMPLGDVAPVLNDDRSALFAEINQGANITRNLKKVTSEMQTHKNPNLRTGPAPFKAPATANCGSPMKTTLPANAPIDKPPVFTRDGKKWLVEYHKGNKDLLVENAEMNNVVYMFRCQDSTLVVKGKVNSVVIDSCRKSSVVFDSLVSSIEFVNCQSVQMQVLGKVPTISIDKTDGCQMYLSPESLKVEIISSKSSEMNVMVPNGNGDYTEFPVPEQFKTTVSPKGLSTIAVDSLG